MKTMLLKISGKCSLCQPKELAGLPDSQTIGSHRSTRTGMKGPEAVAEGPSTNNKDEVVERPETLLCTTTLWVKRTKRKA